MRGQQNNFKILYLLLLLTFLKLMSSRTSQHRSSYNCPSNFPSMHFTQVLLRHDLGLFYSPFSSPVGALIKSLEIWPGNLFKGTLSLTRVLTWPPMTALTTKWEASLPLAAAIIVSWLVYETVWGLVWPGAPVEEETVMAKRMIENVCIRRGSGIQMKVLYVFN